jgi:hypothetical protein
MDGPEAPNTRPKAREDTARATTRTPPPPFFRSIDEPRRPTFFASTERGRVPAIIFSEFRGAVQLHARHIADNRFEPTVHSATQATLAASIGDGLALDRGDRLQLGVSPR